MLNIFEFSRVRENAESWLVNANKLFRIAKPYFSTDIIKRSYFQLVFLAFKTFNEKMKVSYEVIVTVLTVTITPYFNKIKKNQTSLFTLLLQNVVE